MANFSPKKLDAIFNALQTRIVQGVWNVGDQLPTEEALSKEFECSRGTMGRVMAQLAREGMVERRTRAGTRVVRQTLTRPATAIDFDACAFIHPSQQHEGVWRIASGFQQAAFDAKCRTLMLSTGTDFRKEAEIIGHLAEFDVKGAVLFPVILTPADLAYYTQMLLACHFPVVLVEMNIAGMGCPAIVLDGLHAGYTMTKHLLGQGLKKIGFLANYAWSSIVREKYLGYHQAMEEAGLGDSESLVHLDPSMTPRFNDPLREPIELAHTYLKSHPGVEGIVCSVDYIALGMIRAAQELGLQVPGDLKVTGIDDFALAHEGPLGVTTYHVPYETIGRRAFESLNKIIAGHQPLLTEAQVRGELVVRQSA
ncbi:MAG: substrate-binding domain-containing protein [Chthoniobacteraceae bacterium]